MSFLHAYRLHRMGAGGIGAKDTRAPGRVVRYFVESVQCSTRGILYTALDA